MEPEGRMLSPESDLGGSGRSSLLGAGLQAPGRPADGVPEAHQAKVHAFEALETAGALGGLPHHSMQ